MIALLALLPKFLGSKAGAWMIGGLAVVLVGGVLYLRVQGLESDLAKAEAAKAVAEANVATLKSSIADQNAAIEKARADAMAAEAAADARVRSIKPRSAPKPPADLRDLNGRISTW